MAESIKDKKVISVHELADLFGISNPKAYELVNTGRIEVVKVGTRILIPMDNIDKFLHGKNKG